MTTRLRLVVTALFVALLGVAPARPCAAGCVALSPAALFLDPGYQIPLGEPAPIEIQLPDYGTVDFPPQGGALVTLQVVPPQLDALEDVFVVGEDYSGCIDAEVGAGQLDFQRAGPYFVRAGYADGHVDHFEIHVIPVPSSGVDRIVALDTSGWSQISTPTGVHGYRGSQFGSDPTGYNTQATLDGLISQIKSDFADAGGPIDIALRYHGSIAQVSIRKGEFIGLGQKGKPNFDKLCNAMRGRVKSITLLSCRAAKGTKGCEFLQAMSACAGGVPVTASTGKVTTTWKKSNPQGTVKNVTNGSRTSSVNCP